MSEHRIVYENQRFGRYLRRIREDRKLSLDAVEEMTLGYPEPVTKSHLSRIENGRAVPTFPRMFALSRVYGVPISSMAERFEWDLRAGDGGALDLDLTQPDAVIERLLALRVEGRYDVVLKVVEAALERRGAAHDEFTMKLSIWQLSAMIKIGHFESCKVRCEELLGTLPEDSEFYLRALVSFVLCSYRLRRLKVALMGLAQLHSRLEEPQWDDDVRSRAYSTSGSVHHALGDHESAKADFEKAMESFQGIGDAFEACRARINLAQVLIDSGKWRAACRHLSLAIAEASDKRFQRLFALAANHLAVAHFHDNDLDAAESYALRSNAVARPHDWKSIVFRNCYYLWTIGKRRNEAGSVAANERTLRTLVNRIPDEFPEVEAFRRFAEGGDR